MSTIRHSGHTAGGPALRSAECRVGASAATPILVCASVILLLRAAVPAGASDPVPATIPVDYPDTRPLDPVQVFDVAAYDDPWLTLDRNDDGRIDYAVRVDERGYKLYEAMDFNHDGSMDLFCFYRNDVLQRQEIDSNSDGRIDIWVYLHRGVYVRMWERDTDHDGRIDERRDYDQTEP